MPPPPRQDQHQDPRSPRPFPPRPVPARFTETADNSSSDSPFHAPRVSSRFSQLSRRLRDERVRLNEAREIDTSFRQRLRSLHASQSTSTLPNHTSSMLESHQRARDRVFERLEEQNRTRLQQARAEYAAERSTILPELTTTRNSPRSGPNPRRRRRPSYSLLRPPNDETMSAETSSLSRLIDRGMGRTSSPRHRRAQVLADRLNSPFALSRDDRIHLSDTITDSDTDPNDSRDRRPQSKRRKVSHDDALFDGYDPVRYGWKGQVDPGHLRLEIVSCDGGQYDQTLKFRAENVLRNDKSVYCSNSSTCSFLFRHQAETSFNLDALIIKGPESGYTSPVQQGLVFVGMSMDELLRSAAAYQMTYSNSDSSEGPLNERELSDLIEDHNVYLNSQTRDRRHFSENGSAYEQYLSSSMREGLDCDWPILNDILNGNQPTAAPSPPDAEEVTAGFWDMEPSPSDTARGPIRTTVYSYGNHTVIASGNGAAAPPPAERDEDEEEERYGNHWDGYECPEHAHRVTPGRIEKMVTTTVQTRENNTLSPNATFFIRRSQNRITIKFDPPLAGRYILLKLFNPNRQNENIDVQFVSAYGFSGPRFVPALEFR